MTRWRAVFCIASALPPGPGSQNVYQVIIQVGNYERILIGKHPAPHVYAKAPLIRWMPLNEARPRTVRWVVVSQRQRGSPQRPQCSSCFGRPVLEVLQRFLLCVHEHAVGCQLAWVLQESQDVVEVRAVQWDAVALRVEPQTVFDCIPPGPIDGSYIDVVAQLRSIHDHIELRC